MKLLVVFMLAAIPLCCHAGSGCEKLEYLLDVTIDPEVSVSEYKEIMSPYVSNSVANDALEELKECFLKQSNDTLANVKVMLNHIYNSVQCALY
ncbi:mammaglobin-A-like [Dipodomys spectabilis]|uniref:mammaglobin-A-like n=1 Tax=Dipodomys spectabilis TaxID=105255 RepID=UPI001C53F0D3|nr:mammaglobin-A-like [Dipodomys spectabilis]